MSSTETERLTPLDQARALLGLDEEPETEAPEPEPDTDEDEGEEDEEPAVASAWPSFEMQVPDEVAEELAFEEAVAPQAEDTDDEDYGRDPELMQRLRAAEREAAYYRSQRLQDGKKLWTAEAVKFFPLSEPFLDELPAESRRDFLRQAKAMHEKLEPFWRERVQKPTTDLVEAERKKARDEARAAAEIAWGRPPGATGAPAAAQVAVERARAAANQGDLVGQIKAMMGGPA